MGEVVEEGEGESGSGMIVGETAGEDEEQGDRGEVTRMLTAVVEVVVVVVVMVGNCDCVDMGEDEAQWRWVVLVVRLRQGQGRRVWT